MAADAPDVILIAASCIRRIIGGFSASRVPPHSDEILKTFSENCWKVLVFFCLMVGAFQLPSAPPPVGMERSRHIRLYLLRQTRSLNNWIFDDFENLQKKIIFEGFRPCDCARNLFYAIPHRRGQSTSNLTTHPPNHFFFF